MIIDKEHVSFKKKKANNINMVLDLRTLNILSSYVISTSSYIRLSQLLNLKKFIYALNPSTYDTDPDKLKRIIFIKKGLEARLDYNLTDKNFIIECIKSSLDFDVDFIDMENTELNSAEISWVQQMISESLQFFFVYDAADEMIDICTRIKSSDYNHRGDLIREYNNLINHHKTMFREAKSDDSITQLEFSLRPDKFEKCVTETYNILSNPNRRLITGMQGFNEMVHGGLESGRVYALLGITGIGKSITLLNLLYQIKIYNRFYKPKDPTKTPCIFLLTMENTVVETIQRLFDMVVENSMGMVSYNIHEVLRKLREEGRLTLNSDSPIDIVIKYRPNKSIDTNYLYEMCEDLEDEGYEVICLIQDHMKRMRSVYSTSDLRIELGEIVNELKAFAAEKDIPVITNTHLNREAARLVEDDNSKKVDVGLKLGKANIGESMLILDNLDCAIVINVDYDEDGNKYLCMKNIKMREKNGRDYIIQPFVYGSGIRLVEDYYTEPKFVESLHLNRDINSRIVGMKTTSSNVLNTNSMIQNNKNVNSMFGVLENYSLDEEQPIKMKVIKPITFDSNWKKPNITKDSIEELKRDLKIV